MTTTRPRAASEATRKRILDAATSLFLSSGFRATSLREIAAAADITHQGLRRHFADKAALLATALRRFDEEADDDAAHDEDVEIVAFVAGIVRANESKAGWTRLFASVSGEGTAWDHPLHTEMRDRYATHRRGMTAILANSQRLGTVSSDRDVADLTIRLTALWDGFQLLQVYFGDEVSIADGMATETTSLREPRRALTAWAAAPTPEPTHAAVPHAAGYGVGQARRDDILDAAIALFIRHGLHDTSVADIAAAVGVTKATLFHHYPTKDLLARAVMEYSQNELDAASSHASRLHGADRVRAAAVRAQGLVSHAPELIRLHVALCAEATAPEHPLHEHYRRHLSDLVDAVEAAYAEAREDGKLRTDADARTLALRHVALWEGLQLQWCYAPDAADFVRHMREHVDELLMPA